MSHLIFELFSGVGFYNQLFSLETAIYLASISNRKLILLIKYPLCHCGKASWDYGLFMDFFSDNYKHFLPNGIEIYYKTLPTQFKESIEDNKKNEFIIFNNKFSQIGFIDKNIYETLKETEIKKFLNGRKLVVFDVDSYKSEYIYIKESNASRCFANFLTSEENYKKMSEICKSLTILNKDFLNVFEKIVLPKKYTSIHFRFGDMKHNTAYLNNIHKESNFSHLFNLLENKSYVEPIYIMSDREDVSLLETLRSRYDIKSTEDLMPESSYKNYFKTIINHCVVSFLIQKYICEKATKFIGHNGSTVSYHIQYVNYLRNKDYFHYTDRKVVHKNGWYDWNTNSIPGGGIGWKLFFKDNIIKVKEKYSFITLTNDGYLDLTNNLLLSLVALGMSQLLKIYCIGKKSFDYFQDKYPENEIIQIDTNEDYLKTWVEYKAAQHSDTEGKRKWAKITSYKMYAIHNELINGKDVIFTDGDIVFEKNPIPYLLENIKNNEELLIQNDEQSVNTPAMCTGFFYMRSTENTRKITKYGDIDIEKFTNDQQYLRRNGKNIVHSFLDLDLFPNGKYFREKKPSTPYIIHFNYDVSDGKIERMKKYKKWYTNTTIQHQPQMIMSKSIQATLVKLETENEVIEKENEKPNLNIFIENQNIKLRQGYITEIREHSDKLLETIKKYSEFKNARILEIGFLAGHSAELFLTQDESVSVTSIDTGSFQSVKAGKKYIDTHYKNRHMLLIGHSNEILETMNTEEKYDIILIDGSFEYDVVKKDIILCKKFAKEETIVIINGVLENELWIKYWNAYPTRAKKELEKECQIKSICQFDISIGRGTYLGNYIFNDRQ